MTLPHALSRTLRDNDGVLSREQLLAAGCTDAYIRWQLASQRWRRLFPGVYLTSPTAPTWRQRAIAACLVSGTDACLGPEPSLHLLGVGTAPKQVTIWIPAHRRAVQHPGVLVVRRRPEFWPRSGPPPHLTAVQATTHRLTELDDAGDVLTLLNAAYRIGAHPSMVATQLKEASRVRNRALLEALLRDSGAGIESALEYEFHYRVERAHGLPRAKLQKRERLGPMRIRADAVYEEYRLRVELDGQLAHPGGRTEEDTWRDNEVVLTLGQLTLRYRWRHVVVTPCSTAAQLARGLRQRGWRGAPRLCAPGCTLNLATVA